MRFFSYPNTELPDLSNYVLLALDAPPLTLADAQKGLLLIDATWRYAEKMLRFVTDKVTIEKRSIPPGFRTAYPRRQDDCPNPEAGLASIEALYIAYKILERDTTGLLDSYFWQVNFLESFQEGLLFNNRTGIGTSTNSLSSSSSSEVEAK